VPGAANRLPPIAAFHAKRHYIPSYKIVVDGGWNIADAASREYDLEGMQVGTVAAGRIGSAMLRG